GVGRPGANLADGPEVLQSPGRSVSPDQRERPAPGLLGFGFPCAGSYLGCFPPSGDSQIGPKAVCEESGRVRENSAALSGPCRTRSRPNRIDTLIISI